MMAAVLVVLLLLFVRNADARGVKGTAGAKLPLSNDAPRALSARAARAWRRASARGVTHMVRAWGVHGWRMVRPGAGRDPPGVRHVRRTAPPARAYRPLRIGQRAVPVGIVRCQGCALHAHPW